MKIELITQELKNMAVKASKGASNDKLSPLTTYLGIDVKDGVLCLRTTDGANFLVVKKKVKSEDFSVVVECDSFVNLIKKTTSEHIVLDIADDVINIKGNGKYVVPCVVDEHGQPFEFPKAEQSFSKLENPVKVKSLVFKTVNDVNTASVSKVLDTPVLTGFYFDTDGVYTTDSLKLCVFDVNVFKRKALLTLDMIKLSTLFTEEDVMVYFVGNDVVMKSESVEIYGTQIDDIETYPYETLKQLLETEYESQCTIKKVLLNAALDRLAIFVSDYEKNAVNLEFTAEGLVLHSKKASELIPYDTSENFEHFSCVLELPKFKEQVNTIREDIVGFEYGNAEVIVIKEPKITHVLSTMEEG